MSWNSISLTVRGLSPTFVMLCNQFKTELFGRAYGELSLAPL